MTETQFKCQGCFNWFPLDEKTGDTYRCGDCNQEQRETTLHEYLTGVFERRDRTLSGGHNPQTHHGQYQG
jgi:hypothetical protein